MTQIKSSAMRVVKREAEVGEVENVVGQMIKGEMPQHPALNFYGARQVGKTTFLHQLQDRLAKRRLPCTLVEFPRNGDGYKGVAGQLQLLSEIVDTLPAPTTASRAILDEYISVFRAYVESVSKNGPVVLLLDSLDRAEEQFFEWVGAAVLSRLMVANRFLVVATSWHPLEFRPFELRSPRVKAIPLNAFDEPMIRDHLPIEYSDLAPKIMRLTRGHPLCNAYAVEGIRELRIGVEEFDRQESELAEWLWLQCVKPVLMAGVPEETKISIRTLSPLRRFDLTILRAVLPEILAQRFGQTTVADLLRLVAEMVETRWVSWDEGLNSYSIDETLRGIVEHHLCLRDRAQFIETHAIGFKTYGDLVRKVPEMRWIYIIQRLYHHAQVLQVRDGLACEQIEMQLKSELQDYLELYYSQPDTTCLDGVERLEQELGRDLYFHQTFPGLVRIARSFKQELIKRST